MNYLPSTQTNTIKEYFYPNTIGVNHIIKSFFVTLPGEQIVNTFIFAPKVCVC